MVLAALLVFVLIYVSRISSPENFNFISPLHFFFVDKLASCERNRQRK